MRGETGAVDLTFTMAGTEAMRIKSSNVGIGTTSPGGTLHVLPTPLHPTLFFVGPPPPPMAGKSASGRRRRGLHSQLKVLLALLPTNTDLWIQGRGQGDGSSTDSRISMGFDSDANQGHILKLLVHRPVFLLHNLHSALVSASVDTDTLTIKS